MKKTFGFFSVLVFSTFLWGQKQIPYKNSQEVIQQSFRYFENENYEDAIKELVKIYPSDTAYSLARIEIARAHLFAKQYDRTIQVTKDVLQNDPHHNHRFIAYILASTSFIQQKKYEDAIKILDQGIEELPYNVDLYYQKGLVYEQSENYQKALEIYKHNLEVFPFHNLTHLRLAYLALNENHVVEALLSVNMYLLLNPYHSKAKDVLIEFDEILKDKVNFEPTGITLSEQGDNYQRLKLLVDNGVANDKKYKCPSKIKFTFTRQTHFILSQLKYNENDKGFWHQYYLPFYSKMMNEGYFESFSYYTLLSLDKTNSEIKKIATKKNDDLKDFYAWKEKTLQQLHKSFIGDFGEQKNIKLSANYDIDGKIKMIGLAQDDLSKKQGKWVYYSKYGQLEGYNYFKDDVPNGKWQYRDVEKNTIQIESEFKDGKLNGPFTIYHDNGQVKETGVFKNGKRNGKCVHYTYYGTKYKTENYQDGILEGKRTFYYATGPISFEENYVKGKANGIHKGYFTNNNVRSISNYENGIQTGVEEFYYLNGQLKQKQNLVKDLIQGECTEYYPNGHIYKQGKVKKQHYVGVVKVYYPNGKLYKEESYNESGKLHGMTIQYYPNGQKQSEVNYVRNKYAGYKYFDKEGKLMHEGELQKGILNFESYNTYGTLLAKGIVKDNEQDGIWKFYSKYGVLTSVAKYNKGKIETDTNFHSNRQIKSINVYNENQVEDEYFESYNIHGDLKREGWIKDGQMEGLWLYYHPNGIIKDSSYYINNELEGVQKSFDITGKLSQIDRYKKGRHISFTKYDTTGTAIHSQVIADWKDGEVVKINYAMPKNAILNEGVRYNNLRHGEHIWYHSNGQISCKGIYENGKRHGLHTWYNEQGQKTSTQNYFYGQLDGESKRYYSTGEVKEVGIYKNDNLENEELTYYRSGRLMIKSSVNYEGERHGKTYYYSPEEQVQHIRYYDNEQIIGYAYLGKDGKEVEMIPIENGTKKIVNYFPNGKKSMEFTLKNGDFEGDYIRYYESGQIQRKSTYKNGDDTGMHITYYADGKVELKEPYIKGYRHGVCEYFDKNGQKTLSKEYNTGYLHGKTHYYENGKIVKTEYYYFDDFIR